MVPLNGILLIDKPLRRTSMDVSANIRARFRRGGAPKRLKVGHAGTLDPLATGLLVVMVGRATSLCERLMAERKEYLTTIDLSCVSTTDDAEGERTFMPVDQPPSLATMLEAAAKLCMALGTDGLRGGWYLVSVTSSPAQVQAAVAACKEAVASLKGPFGIMGDRCCSLLVLFFFSFYFFSFCCSFHLL
jgi:hypothetical protein